MFRRLGHKLRQLPSIAFWYDPPVVHGQIYYVDATAGNDANDGLHPLRAWQTIGQVNGETFDPEDRVLFRRGETWVGVALVPPSSGSPGRPIVFGAYGVGAMPIIDGNDLVNCVTANGRNHLVFSGLEVTQGLDVGFNFIACSNIDVINCDAHDCGNDNLLFITGCYNCSVIGGEFYNAYERVLTTTTSGIEIADDCYNITISDVTCRNNAGALGMGITIHSHVATGMPYNITIENCVCHTNAAHGIQAWKADDNADADSNINIINCTTYGNTLDGVRIYKSAAAANYPTGVSVYEHYSHTNTRYAYWFEGDSFVVRNNVFRGRGFISACDGMGFWNNTMYFEVGAGLYPLYIQNARTNDVEVINNITYATVAGGMMIGVDAAVGAADVDIDYNLYYLGAETVLNTRWHWLGVAHNWANWLLNSGEDANSPMADQDPLFTNPGAGDFTLQAGSPAIDAGVDVGLPYLGTAPDCGAFERE